MRKRLRSGSVDGEGGKKGSPGTDRVDRDDHKRSQEAIITVQYKAC